MESVTNPLRMTFSCVLYRVSLPFLYMIDSLFAVCWCNTCHLRHFLLQCISAGIKCQSISIVHVQLFSGNGQRSSVSIMN